MSNSSRAIPPGVVGLRLYVERDNADAHRTYQALGMVDAGYAIYESEFAVAALT